MITTSYPALLSSVPNVPCALASPTPWFAGDFDTKAWPFPPVGHIVPAIGPVARISGLSGLNGSTPGLEFSSHRRMPRPIPPMYFLAYSSFNGSTWVFPEVRSTCRTRPA